MHVLLVDDDAEIRLSLSLALERRGHSVSAAPDVRTALALVEGERFDATVVDLMLPDGDGFTLCRTIRSRSSMPILMLSAREDDTDIVGGLESGADDYVVKPVSVAVLEARLRALVRRTAGTTADDDAGVTRIGDLTIRAEQFEADGPAGTMPLSSTEFRLLIALAEAEGRPRTRRQLIDDVWAEHAPDTVRVVDTTIQRLRAKLDESGVGTPTLETMRGIGYRLR